MEPWAEHLLDLWHANRVTVGETIVEAIVRNSHMPVKYTLDDVTQMLEGHHTMMKERFTGSGTDIWDTYFNAVIPGILEQGQPLSALVGQVTMNAVILQRVLVPLARKEDRDQIAEFLLHWYMETNSEIVKIGLSCGAKS